MAKEQRGGAGVDARRRKSEWSVDRRLPIALLSAIGLQSATAIWWAASISYRVDALEKRSEAMTNQSERLVRVEDAVKSLESSVQEKAAQLKESFATGIDDLKRLVLAQWQSVKAAPVEPDPSRRRDR